MRSMPRITARLMIIWNLEAIFDFKVGSFEVCFFDDFLMGGPWIHNLSEPLGGVRSEERRRRSEEKEERGSGQAAPSSIETSPAGLNPSLTSV